MNLPAELAAKLLARQNQIEPCVARLKKAIESPEQINTIIHELRSYQRELEDAERKEELEAMTEGMNKSRLLVEQVNYDLETRQRIIRVIEHFCPMQKGSISADRWIQYHQLSAGIVDNCPEKVAGATPGSLLKYSRKPDMVQVWKDKGSALFTTKHEMGIPKRTRGLLTFTLDELDYAEEIMERDIIEMEETIALKGTKKKSKKGRSKAESDLEDETAMKKLMDDAMQAILENGANMEEDFAEIPVPQPAQSEDPMTLVEEEEVAAPAKPAPKKGRKKKAPAEKEDPEEGEDEADTEEGEENEEEEEEEEEEDTEEPARSRSQRSTRGTRAAGKKRAASAGSSPARKRTRASTRGSKPKATSRRSSRKG